MALRHHGLRLGPLDNATYVLWCERTRAAAVVDPGFGAGEVVRWLRERPEPLRVIHLLATHAHYDHVCGARELQAAVGGEFRLHPADRPLLVNLDVQAAAWGFPRVEAPAEVHDLADGERLALGEEWLEVIHTPGHSPGGVCFRGGDDLWSGDTLFADSVGRTDLPGGSPDDLLRSIRTRLLPLGDAVRVHPGHGPATTIGHERAENPFVGEEGDER